MNGGCGSGAPDVEEGRATTESLYRPPMPRRSRERLLSGQVLLHFDIAEP